MELCPLFFPYDVQLCRVWVGSCGLQNLKYFIPTPLESKESAQKFVPTLVGLSLCVTLKVSVHSLCSEYLCFNYIMLGGFCFLLCVVSVVLFCVLCASCIGRSLAFPRLWNFFAVIIREIVSMPSAWDSFPTSHP